MCDIVTNQSLLAPQANVGGRLRMVITGAAPTSPTVLSFLRAALGCQVRTPVYIYSTLPFKGLGSPRQFYVFHEKSHFYLPHELENE